jgi:hypothetical protein
MGMRSSLWRIATPALRQSEWGVVKTKKRRRLMPCFFTSSPLLPASGSKRFENKKGLPPLRPGDP